MNANELRIGNWVSIDNWVIDVDEISNDKIDISNGIEPYDIKDIKPIPLTEEWLIRFGFHKSEAFRTKHIGGFIDGLCELFMKTNGSMFWVYSFSEVDGTIWFITKITYVHQLQNLYFALTGEELNLRQ